MPFFQRMKMKTETHPVCSFREKVLAYTLQYVKLASKKYFANYSYVEIDQDIY